MRTIVLVISLSLPEQNAIDKLKDGMLRISNDSLKAQETLANAELRMYNDVVSRWDQSNRTFLTGLGQIFKVNVALPKAINNNFAPIGVMVNAAMNQNNLAVAKANVGVDNGHFGNRELNRVLHNRRDIDHMLNVQGFVANQENRDVMRQNIEGRILNNKLRQQGVPENMIQQQDQQRRQLLQQQHPNLERAAIQHVHKFDNVPKIPEKIALQGNVDHRSWNLNRMLDNRPLT
jgi:hypothetical protein